jgi:hypothetical protein
MEPLLLRQARRASSPKRSAICAKSSPCRCRRWRRFAPPCWDRMVLPPAARWKVLLNTCTVGVPFLREIEAALAPQGVKIVDCPIFGGPAGARWDAVGHGVGRPGGGRESAVRPTDLAVGPDADQRRRQAGSGAGAEADQQHPVRGLARRHVRGVRDGRQGRARSRGDAERDQRRQRPQRRDIHGAAECRCSTARSATGRLCIF